MAKILITGSEGQLGSEFKQLKDEFNHEFIFTDIDSLDITNNKQLDIFFSKNKIDFILNCAAYTAVDKAETEKENALKINSEAVKNLVTISTKYLCKLVHISTDYVFNGNSNVPYNETDKTNPIGFYGFSKLEGEKAIISSDIDYIIIRTSWLYSSFGNNFVKTILKHSKLKSELSVVYDQIGTPTYARDLAKLIFFIISSHSFKKGIYHYSNEGVCSWYDFAIEIVKMSELNCKINPIESKDFPTPTKRPNYSVLNKEKIKKSFGIEIPYWKDSLIECFNYLDK